MGNDVKYQIHVSGIAYREYPVDTAFAILWCNENEDEAIVVPKRWPYSGEWGEDLADTISINTGYPFPKKIDIVYLSIIEKKFYSLECDFPFEVMSKLWQSKDMNTGRDLYDGIIVGMAPYGRVAIWLNGYKKETLIAWLKGERIDLSMDDFMPGESDSSLNDLWDFYINNDSYAKDCFEKKGVPTCDLIDKYMQQFVYRYMVLFEQWDEFKKKWQKYFEDKYVPEFNYLEEALYDGTHDKLHDGVLMNYHQSGKPKKLAVKWHIKKSEYTAYFWFEDEEIRTVFDRFYGAHPETKTDFMIRIDAEKNKYELALYRYGLKEPYVISESAYQLIVFKNKFERYRSENYNQPRGAWIW